MPVIKCSKCDGNGRIECDGCFGRGYDFMACDICDECGMTGKVTEYKKKKKILRKCFKCKGKGTIKPECIKKCINGKLECDKCQGYGIL